MKNEVYIALGSNLGRREKYLTDAAEHISRMTDTAIMRISDIYETEPVGNTEQGRFLNMAVSIDTAFEPLELLEELQKIETSLGRVRTVHWGPRTIDLDILLFNSLNIQLPRLVIPHPRMFERAFVLVPLKDILPHSRIMGMDIDELIEKCGDRDGVKLHSKFT